MRNLAVVLIVALALVAIPGVRALDWTQMLVVPGGFGIPLSVMPGEAYSKTFTFDEVTGIPFQSCHNSAAYQAGTCDFLYKCYIILPQSCSQVSCAKQHACVEILVPLSSDTVQISYTTSQSEIGQTYGVAAFLSKDHLVYDFSKNLGCSYLAADGTTVLNWCNNGKLGSYSTALNSTFQYDSIQIVGAPAPVSPGGWTGVGAWLNSILEGIRSAFCTYLHIFC